MFDRATRLCATSPTMATRRPSNGKPRSRIVYRSSKAWVGCSCQPSPALMTEDLTPRASVSAAPADECRSTMISACIASILRAVSSSVSPLTTLLEEGEKLMTSALKRFAASSNDVLVLVLGSKNRFTTVRPRSAGTFLISRPVTSLKESAVSRISLISSADKGAKLRRSLRLRLIAASPLHLENDNPVVFARLLQQHLNVLFSRGWNVFPDVRRLDWQLAMSSIDEHGQLNLRGAPEIDQTVHCGTDRPPGKQDVVDQHHDLA